MPQPVVQSGSLEYRGWDSGLGKWLHRFQRSGVPPTGKGMPMRRLGGL